MKVRTGSLFGQLLALVDRDMFRRLVGETGAERASKGFGCWDQFVAMLFGQLAQAKSLREIEAGLRSCEGKLRHVGLEDAPRRSTLAYANGHRPCQLFEQLFYALLASLQGQMPRRKLSFRHKILSLDATVIELCASMFDWVTYRQGKGAAKIHLLLDHEAYLPVYALITEGNVADITVAQGLKLPKGSLVVMDRGYTDYHLYERWCEQGVGFVTRLKKGANYWVMEERPVPRNRSILKDQIVEFHVFHAGRKITHTYRRVEVWLEDKQEVLVLLTNRLDLGASTIAAIYKERWQIELFFKALKQNLRIKTFVGTSANAVRIQIWTALMAMLLVKFLQLRSRFGWALSNLITLLRWNLFTYKNLWTWIHQPHPVRGQPPVDTQLHLFLDSRQPA